MNRLANLLQSPAHWCGLALAALALAPQALGWLPWGGWALPPLGYGLGFAAGGLAFGWPLRRSAWRELAVRGEESSHAALAAALDRLRALVMRNPQDRLSSALQTRVLELCAQLQHLLAQWETSRGQLSLEDSFQARQIVLRYLPEALQAYLAIPARFARDKVLDNGRTAEATLRQALDDLSAKVLQLTEDLAAQDAEAFLGHSRFLEAKFRPPADPVRPPR